MVRTKKMMRKWLKHGITLTAMCLIFFFINQNIHAESKQGGNLTLNKPVTANIENYPSGRSPALALDGDDETFWQPDGNERQRQGVIELIVDLEEKSSFNEAFIYLDFGLERIESIAMEYSSNGEEWKNFFLQDHFEAQKGLSIAFDTVKGKLVKIVFKPKNATLNFRLNEFELYHNTGSSQPTVRQQEPNTNNTNVPQVKDSSDPNLMRAASVLEASASSTAGRIPEHTIDGDLETMWQPEGNKRAADGFVWVSYDLGEPKTFSETVIEIYTGNPANLDYIKIEHSDDQTSWKEAYRTDGSVLNSIQATFPEVTARYVRVWVQIAEGKGGANFRLHEFQLFNEQMIQSHEEQVNDIASHWAKDDIEQLLAKQIVGLLGKGKFVPNQPITRGDFTAYLVNGLQLEKVGSDEFTDVPVTDANAGAIGAAVKAGLIQGMGDGQFAPGAYITREQMSVIFARAMKLQNKEPKLSEQQANSLLANFTDRHDMSDWAQSDVAMTVESKIIQGTTDQKFVPKNNATRAEATVMLKRFLNFLGL